MVVESHRDGYESQLFTVSEGAFSNGNFIGEDIIEKPFLWNTTDLVTAGRSSADYVCAHNVERRIRVIADYAVQL